MIRKLQRKIKKSKEWKKRLMSEIFEPDPYGDSNWCAFYFEKGKIAAYKDVISMLKEEKRGKQK